LVHQKVRNGTGVFLRNVLKLILKFLSGVQVIREVVAVNYCHHGIQSSDVGKRFLVLFIKKGKSLCHLGGGGKPHIRKQKTGHTL